MKSNSGQWDGDVIVTIRYKESDFPGDKPKLLVSNGKQTAITEYRKHAENGMVSETTRMKVAMTFEGRFDLFPFDTQELDIDFTLNGLSNDEAVFEQDPEGETGIHAIEEETGRRFKEAQFRIVGWEIKIKPKKIKWCTICQVACIAQYVC